MHNTSSFAEAFSPEAAARRQVAESAAAPAPEPRGWERDVTLVVTAFERPACIAQFVQSARATFPALPILVCDASATPLFAHETRLGARVRWLALPKARGHTVGAGRNFALSHVQTPLFFLCDDDHVLGPHADLARMHAFLQRHAYDLVGGCQGRDDYGASVLRCERGVLRQRFYQHHGEIEPGAVRCDRVSNTFLARVAPVAAVGWEERVHGDEHTEFFWRARAAGLRVAQLGGTYVLHRRGAERASAWWAWLLKPFLAHADRGYLRLRQGGGRAQAQAAFEAHCLRKNGLVAMRSTTRWRDRRAFLRLMRA